MYVAVPVLVLKSNFLPVYRYLVADGLVHPITKEDPGFEYIKPAEGAAASDMLVVYELQDGKRNPRGSVGYLDGSVRR